MLDDLREFPFVDTFATALSEVRVTVQTALAEAEIACGRADAMIPRLEVLSAEHPFRERLWAQLITAYYVAERQSEALNAYRRLKTNLAENLGIDPGPTVRSLHERILRQEPLDTSHAAQTTATRAVAAPGRTPAPWRARQPSPNFAETTGSATDWRRRTESAAVRTTTSFSTTTMSAATTRSSSTPGGVS